MDLKQITEAMKEANAPVLAKLEEQDARLKALEGRPATDHGKGIVGAGASATQGPVIRVSKAADVARERKIVAARDVHKGKGLDFAALIRLNAVAKMEGRNVVDIAERDGYPEIAKALSAGSYASGGALIPPEFASEVIELLDATAVVRSLGPRILQMPRGTLNVPRVTAGATAAYVGENTAPTPSSPTTDLLTLSAKKLAALVVVSNDLIRQGGPAVDATVRDDLVRKMANRQDLAFLRGSGASYEPRGIENAAAASQAETAYNSTTPSLAQVDATLHNVMGKLQDNNVDHDESCAWIMPPRVARYLSQLRDGTGPYVFRDEIRGGRLHGFRLAVSTQIPTNLGGGTNESRIYFVKMSEVFIGDTLQMEVSFHENAAYDDSGTVKSGLSQDQSVFRALSEHDIALRHDKGAAYATAVKWGA
jgi:HK97 family phage major capsid protein